MMIWQALDDQGIPITPIELGAAFGMPGATAFKLLGGRQWWEGGLGMLEAMAVRIGLQVPWLDPESP
jgi:hypothetical protein